MTTAIIYHYYEVNKTYKNNFIFFLNTAIKPDAHYFLFISGACSIDLPKLPNVNIYFIENKNNDFGAVIEFDKLSKSYEFDSYIFVNSSVRGPFLATYYKKMWYEAFTSQLSENVGLVGSSINLLPKNSAHSIEFENRHNYEAPFIHVQTTAYALSANSYKVLENHNFFNKSGVLKRNEVILDYEILMSQILMKSGFTITSLLPTLTNFNSIRKNIDVKNFLQSGDMLYKSAFYGRTLSPVECLFVKTNRNMITENDLCSHTFTALLEQYEKNGLDTNGVDLLNQVTGFEKTEINLKISLTQLRSVFSSIKVNLTELIQRLKAIFD